MLQCIDTIFWQYMHLLKRFKRLLRLCFWAFFYFIRMLRLQMYLKLASLFLSLIGVYRMALLLHEQWERVRKKGTIFFRLFINSLCVSVENRAMLNFSIENLIASASTHKTLHYNSAIHRIDEGATEKDQHMCRV